MLALDWVVGVIRKDLTISSHAPPVVPLELPLFGKFSISEITVTPHPLCALNTFVQI